VRPPPQRPTLSDTSPDADAVLTAGLRAMTPAQRLARALDLMATVETLAAARTRAQHGESLSDREVRLRLAALRLDRETMVQVASWGPKAEEC
jgi:hypothetical protein